MSEQNTDVKSLAHTKWNCKYHVVFAPKYRRKVFYNEKKEAIREIIRTLCQWKGVEIMSSPHLLHFTRFGALIFQLALLLSLLALEDLFFGQIDIGYTSLKFLNKSRTTDRGAG